MTDLFKTPSNDDNRNYLEELVGEGKKFATLEDLAKSVDHKDKVYIPRLEQENEQLRQELQKRLTIEEYVEKMSASKGHETHERDEPNQGNHNQLNPDQLKNDVLAQVTQLFEQQKKQTVAERNVEKVREALQKQWGSSYSSKLTQRAAELNLTQEFLAKLAEENPNGFLSIVLPNNHKTSPAQMTAPPRSSSVTALPETSGERTKSYYDKLRKENPKLYWSAKIQAQEHRDAVRLREAFFDN